MRLNRATATVVLGTLLTFAGCGTGGGPSQMLELTKPHMDREVETDGAPAATVETHTDTTPAAETRGNDLRPAAAPRR